MSNAISENIKNLRIAKKMTQSDLAVMLGVTKGTISSYESGTRSPSYDVLISLAKIFQVSTDNLLGFSSTYTVDVSALSRRQRNIINEIISSFMLKNEKVIEVINSDCSEHELVQKGFINEFDISEYIKSQYKKGKNVRVFLGDNE